MTSEPHRGDSAELRFRTLLYRFIFFDWLFHDVGSARTPFERHAATQHNRRMSKYLPVYLRRWSFLTRARFRPRLPGGARAAGDPALGLVLHLDLHHGHRHGRHHGRLDLPDPAAAAVMRCTKYA